MLLYFIFIQIFQRLFSVISTLDEFGEWFHDPALAAAFLEKRRKSSVVSTSVAASVVIQQATVTRLHTFY